jgi:hypothetical protein
MRNTHQTDRARSCPRTEGSLVLTFFKKSNACEKGHMIRSSAVMRIVRAQKGKWRTSRPRACLNLSGWMRSDFLRYCFLISLSVAPTGKSRISYGLREERKDVRWATCEHESETGRTYLSLNARMIRSTSSSRMKSLASLAIACSRSRSLGAMLDTMGSRRLLRDEDSNYTINLLT